MKKFTFLLGLFLLFSLPAYAYEAPPEKMKPICVDKNIKDKFPQRDGDFSALLMPITESQLKEFSKPSEEMLNLNRITKAKRGDHIPLKILFLGMALDENSMADVTYDLKILAPNGQIYSNADLKDMRAGHGKLSDTKSSIFDNTDYTMIRFEPKDQLGVYKVIVEIRDNVGKKKINLQEEIELTE